MRFVLYLSAPPNLERVAAYRDAGIGVMLTPRMGNTVERAHGYLCFGCDNDCYAQGPAFRLDVYLAWLLKLRPLIDRCLFATAPDVVGDAVATWERSRLVLPVLRALGFRAALVGQDGLDRLRVPWDDFDCLFIGGTDDWKLSEPCCALMAEGKQRGKFIHVGRVNSRARLLASKAAGADSADGTYVAFGPDKNLPKLRRWVAEARQQMALGELS